MRVLLIYSQYAYDSKFDLRVPSMSLVYLASALERNGHQVTIYDASLGPIRRTGTVFRYGISDEEVHNFLRSHKFDVVGITCPFATKWKFVSKIAEQVKELYPNVLVFLGGLFPTYDWEYCMDKCSAVDVIMLGEAELTFTEVIDNISCGYSVDDACRDVDGVAWRRSGKIFCNAKHNYNNNLDDLPLPAWHLIDFGKYFSLQKSVYDLPAPCLPILSSRSCPYRCRFCNMYLTHGFQWRARSAKNILNEFQYLIRTFNVHNFYFIDDNFSLDLERAKSICRGMMNKKLNIRYNFYSGLSIKTIDYELVQLMKKSGCTSVCLGVESGSERVRNEIYGKKLSTKKIFEVFNFFHEENIPIIGFFMVGAPGEKRTDFDMTKELMRKLPLSLVGMAMYTPYPGTALYDECKNKGWLLKYSPDDEKRVELKSPTLKTADFCPEEIEAWRAEFYYSFIRHHWRALIKETLRPGGIVNFDMIGKFIGLIKFRIFSRKHLQRNGGTLMMKTLKDFIELTKKIRLYARVGLKGVTPIKAYMMSRYWILTNIFKMKIPWLIIFSVTYRCQCNCPHCSVGGYLNKGGKRDELTTEQIKDALSQALRMGIPKIDFFGGEPLLKKDIVDLIKFGAKKGLYMSLTTNGWLLTKELAKKLKDARIGCINISLDSASEERHDRLRGLRGLYQKVINGVKYCYEEGLPCIVSTYITRNSIKNFGSGRSDDSPLTKLISLAKEIKASGIRILFPISSGRWEEDRTREFTEAEKRLVIDNIDNSFAFIEGAFSVKNKQKVCQSLSGRMFNISPYGDVQICVTYHDIFGNVKDKPLADLVRGMYESSLYIKNRGGTCCSTTGLIR